ncbi:MAG: hypothetical protein AMK73_07985 [Planctomycetes bacterium SM23_32]|nr:MAG: hypothetical protein AMK73_07985 [Planctomycetes bacterium SM23_32]
MLDNSASPHAKLRAVGLDEVRWTEGFWADRFRQCAAVTLPHLWKLAADPDWGHALENLRIAAGLAEGTFAGTHWQDAWVYKWIEAASVVCALTGDGILERQMDDAITVIAAAQQPDGYVASQVTARGWERFQDPRHHELYVMGHLITAACIHHRMTGKGSLLAVARRAGDYLCRTFIERDPALAHFPLNPSVIMAAVELYRTTGERRYLKLANAFIDGRGAAPGGSDLNQDRVPLREETQVVGHAVFFTYLYAGAADAFMETGDPTLLEALERLWEDLTRKRIYVTGGVCALHRGFSVRGGNVWSADDVHEAAGPDFHLPNATAYNETCGQVGSFMWNWRMLLATARARCADLMEWTLYNGILPGIGLDGASWFYTNPLRWHGREHELLSQDAHQRFQPGTPPARHQICCPTNLLRTFAELHGCAYSTSQEGAWMHLYGGSECDLGLPRGGRIRLRQETDYPWDGEVLVRVESAPEAECTLMLRIPRWAEGTELSVNGEPAEADARPGSYAALRRRWCAADEVRLSMPMPVRLIEAHPRVEEARHQVAVTRGPLVYCLESPDLPEGMRVSEACLLRDAGLTPALEPDLLGGVVVLEGQVLRVPEGDWSARLYRPVPPAEPEWMGVRLIPYYAWANRGISEMTVWLPIA